MSTGKAETMRWLVGLLLAAIVGVGGYAWIGGSAVASLDSATKSAAATAGEAAKGVATHESKLSAIEGKATLAEGLVPRVGALETKTALNEQAIATQGRVLEELRGDVKELLRRVPPR